MALSSTSQLPYLVCIVPETHNPTQAASDFGLISRSYPTDESFDPDHTKTQWERLANQINALNRNSSSNVFYKLLIMGRHGEGNHNVAERRYGTALWDVRRLFFLAGSRRTLLMMNQCHYSLLDGDETGNWVDARLNEVGIAQAELAHRTWERQIEAKIPPPQSYYVSPLNRCLATAAITFRGLDLPGVNPFRPMIKEVLPFLPSLLLIFG